MAEGTVWLCHTPSTNRYGYERSNGLLRHSSICAYTPLELVRERLRGHPLAPQQAADVVDLTGRNAGQVHVDQRLLDALLTTPVSFDHRRLEQRALELRVYFVKSVFRV